MKKLIVALSFVVVFLFTSPTFAYTVKSGDTMTRIAKDHHLTLQELAEVNPQIHDLDLIFVGQTVNTTKPVQSASTEVQENHVVHNSFSDNEIDLLARLVRAEAQIEPFEGKVAVACVVLNRVEHPQFPNTIREVIYAPGQFQPVSNGEINKPADEESINAVKAALNEQRQLAPGSLFFYNPAIASSRWLDSRATTLVIGQHVFKK
nr:cell wall hydrolase [Neobacillus sp. Marseille-Q6967]